MAGKRKKHGQRTTQVVDEKPCLMKGEQELVMVEGTGGGQERKEAQHKSLFYVTVIRNVKMADKAQFHKNLLKICGMG